MTDAAVVYEVTLEVETDIVTEFDQWLAGHVQALLQLPGFTDARVLRGADGASPTVRVVQYLLSDQRALDDYLRIHAARMRDAGLSRFGSRFKASRRSFPANELEQPATAPASVLRCLNCDTPLSGRFCVECGQPNHTVVAPLWETIEEFFGNHFGLDTKFFHSVIPLLLRPGFLTREYCAGRRERYIKPLRLYLFSSILFFFCAAWLIPTQFADSVTNGGAVPTIGTAQRNNAQTQLNHAIAQINADPGLGPGQKAALTALLQHQSTKPDGNPAAPRASTTSTGAAKSPASAGAGESAFTRHVVERIGKIKSNPQEFSRQLLYHTIPKAMFLFLPLVALLLTLLYLRRRHLYMEHLIFTLHVHALFFLVLLTGLIVSAVGRHFLWPAAVDDAASEVLKWYLLIYLFLAMRNFYQQSWFKTAIKFCLMISGYMILAIFGFVGALAVAFMEA